MNKEKITTINHEIDKITKDLATLKKHISALNGYSAP